MGIMDKFMSLLRHEKHTVEGMEIRSEHVSHDLTNLKARIDVLSRLVSRMKDDKPQQSRDPE